MSTTTQARILRNRFRANLRRIRLQRNLTQTAAAKRARVSQGYWAQLEQGARVPGVDVIGRLAKALGVEPEILLSGRNCP